MAMGWKAKFAAFIFSALLLARGAISGQSRIQGQLKFEAHGWYNQMAGVWVDGQYLGYVKELHGDRTVFLMPGKHTITVREAGYEELTEPLVANPGERYMIAVDLQKDPQARYSRTPAVVKVFIKPGRAAVFVDSFYAGHANEFSGAGDALLLNPGRHHIEISLPGYRPFQTEVSLRPNQQFELATELVPGSILQADTNVMSRSADPEK